MSSESQSRQRQLIKGAALEFLGILALATRFAAGRGGTILIGIGAVSVVIGLGLQIRAILSSPTV